MSMAANGSVHSTTRMSFAGRLDKSELGRLERTMVRAVRAPEGDYRDWEDIAEWAASIADGLAAMQKVR